MRGNQAGTGMKTMATYKVKLVRDQGESRETVYLYVNAPGTKAGYDKAADRAQAKMEADKRPGFRIVGVNCVG